MVLTSGIDTSAFLRNPVLLYMHRRGKVFGNWINLKTDDGKLYADPVFDLEDQDEELQSVAGKVDRGFLKACSMGIEILEAYYSEELSCPVVTKCILEEISVVDVGSNRYAIRLYADGKPLEGEDLTSKLAQLSAPPATTQPLTQLQTMSFLKGLAIALALAETASEQDVQNAITTLSADRGYKKKYDDLQTELSTKRTQEAETLVQAAIDDKRITATMKSTYMTLFAADHENAKAILATLQKPVDLAQFATTGTQNATLATATDKKTAIDLYDQMDRDGSLMQLSASNKPEYVRLFTAKHGVAPSS